LYVGHINLLQMSVIMLQASVNIDTNLLVPLNVGYFLTSDGDCYAFWTLLHKVSYYIGCVCVWS